MFLDSSPTNMEQLDSKKMMYGVINEERRERVGEIDRERKGGMLGGL